METVRHDLGPVQCRAMSTKPEKLDSFLTGGHPGKAMGKINLYPKSPFPLVAKEATLVDSIPDALSFIKAITLRV